MSDAALIIARDAVAALEWRADYLEREAREARAKAARLRIEYRLPAPRGTIPNHAPLEWPCAR